MRERRGSPSSEAMASAIRTIESKAKFDGVKHEVFLRVANLGDRVYIDMCDDHWRAIEIDADGWRIVDDVPIYFRREAGMLPLPMPSAVVPKEGIKRLNEVLRLKDEGDLVLIVHWALAALASRSPFTVLCFAGEPGATKTSAAFVVRSMVDPNVAPMRSRPKDVHEVFVAAAHSLVVGYNNLSHVPDWLSDAICVISEGSGESQREYFTNADEFLILVRAPFLITSIENLIRRGDLAQRTLTIHLAVPERYLPEEEFRLKFRRIHADVLGALCGAITHGLKAERTLKIDVPLPRMATFYRWGLVCEGALWPKGTFETAFEVNALGAVEDVIEGEKAAYQLRLFMMQRGEEWAGTATLLLVELVHYVRRPVREAEAAYAKATEAGKYAEKAEVEKAAAELREARERARDVLSDGWPKAANALAGKLKRASPALRKAGIVIEWPSRHGEVKIIKIKYMPTPSPGRTDRPCASGRPEGGADLNAANNLAGGRRDAVGTTENDFDSSRDGRPAGLRRDDPLPAGTAVGRSPPQPSSRPNIMEKNDNPPSGKSQDGWDDPCGCKAGVGSALFAAHGRKPDDSEESGSDRYPDEPAKGDEDGPDEDDRPEGGKGVL